MRNDIVFKDSRLLEALDYIDSDLIAGAMEELRIDECQPSSRKSTARAFLAFAACLVFLILSFPMANYITALVSSFTAGAGSGTESSEVLNTEPIETTNLIEETSPFFWMYTPELEPLTQEQVDACNQAWRLKLCGTLEEYIASYPEGKEQNAEKDYYEVMFISTKRSRPYFGTFNDAIVTAGLMIGISGLEVENVELGGHIIHFQVPGGISVYKDGTVISIHEAYERGWLTDDDIGAISERMDKFNEALNRRNN